MLPIMLGAIAAADTGQRCASCGYNLTGIVSTRCPECGSLLLPLELRRSLLAEIHPATPWERERGIRTFLSTVKQAVFAFPGLARDFPPFNHINRSREFASICYMLASMSVLVVAAVAEFYLAVPGLSAFGGFGGPSHVLPVIVSVGLSILLASWMFIRLTAWCACKRIAAPGVPAPPRFWRGMLQYSSVFPLLTWAWIGIWAVGACVADALFEIRDASGRSVLLPDLVRLLTITAIVGVCVLTLLHAIAVCAMVCIRARPGSSQLSAIMDVTMIGLACLIAAAGISIPAMLLIGGPLTLLFGY